MWRGKNRTSPSGSLGKPGSLGEDFCPSKPRGRLATFPEAPRSSTKIEIWRKKKCSTLVQSAIFVEPRGASGASASGKVGEEEISPESRRGSTKIFTRHSIFPPPQI